MKFRFVGGLDCPDWILTEIASLSKISVIKFKHWCSTCISNLLTAKKWTDEQIQLLNADSSLGNEDVKAMVAALTFVLEKAAKSSCSAGDLELEMQQLGLPAEHCKQLFKVYGMNFEKLKTQLTSTVQKGPSLKAVSGSVVGGDEKNKCYVLDFQSTAGEKVSIAMDEAKLNFLHKELNDALQLVSLYTQKS